MHLWTIFPLTAHIYLGCCQRDRCHLLPRQRLLSISIRNFPLGHFLLIYCQFYSITMASLSRCDQSTLSSDNLKQSENFSLEHKVVRWAHILLEQLHSLETKWEALTFETKFGYSGYFNSNLWFGPRNNNFDFDQSLEGFMLIIFAPS